MLRAIILSDGQGQVILDEVPDYQIEVYDLQQEDRDETRKQLQKIRENMSHQKLDTSHWPLFDIKASKFEKNKVRLHISIDNIIIDAWSTSYILGEWARLYENPEMETVKLEVSFSDYVRQMKEIEHTFNYQRAKEYWEKRLQYLPIGPQLPLQCSPEEIVKQRFIRYEYKIPKFLWGKIKEWAKKYHFTLSVVILTAYAEVLAQWSGSNHFSINITLFNRLPLHKQIN